MKTTPSNKTNLLCSSELDTIVTGAGLYNCMFAMIRFKVKDESLPKLRKLLTCIFCWNVGELRAVLNTAIGVKP